jgi:hypothetical protein
MDGQSIMLEYHGPGNPERLSKIIEIPKAGQATGRVSTFGYNSRGELTSISHDVGTIDEATTAFQYGIAHHLLEVTPPGGRPSNLDYRAEHRWDVPGDAEGFAAEGRATAVSQSSERSFRGAGSLRVDISDLTSALYARPAQRFATPVAWNAVQQELLGYVYAPGPARLEARLVLQDGRGDVTWGPWWALAPDLWTQVRLPAARVDPGYKAAKVSFELRTGAGQPPYTGPVWVDHLLVRGVVDYFTDNGSPQQKIARFGYDWNALQTTIQTPSGEDPIVQPGMYSYDGQGVLTSPEDPVEAYWTPERMAAAQPLPAPSVPPSSLTDNSAPQPEGPEEWHPGGDETGVPPYESLDLVPPQTTPQDTQGTR